MSFSVATFLKLQLFAFSLTLPFRTTDVAHLACSMDISFKEIWLSCRAAQFSGFDHCIPALINVL